MRSDGSKGFASTFIEFIQKNLWGILSLIIVLAVFMATTNNRLQALETKQKESETVEQQILENQIQMKLQINTLQVQVQDSSNIIKDSNNLIKQHVLGGK